MMATTATLLAAMVNNLLPGVSTATYLMLNIQPPTSRHYPAKGR
jgi:hypothetical protein